MNRAANPFVSEAFTYLDRHAPVDSFIAREFVRGLPTGSRLRFLDVGAAPGRKGSITTLQSVKRFSRAGARVEAHATDQHPPNEIAGKTKYGVTYHKAELESHRDELPTGQFDVLRLSNVGMYLNSPRIVTARMAAKLREGGILVETNPVDLWPQLPFPEKLPKHAKNATLIYQKRNGRLVLLQAIKAGPPLGQANVKKLIAKRIAEAKNAGELEEAGRISEHLERIRKSYLQEKENEDRELKQLHSALGITPLRTNDRLRKEARDWFRRHHTAASREAA